MAKGKGRSKSKEAFWRRLVGRHERSGLSIREFCREHGQRETAFYFWRRELARREAVRPAPATFLPVQVAAEDATPAGGRIEIVLTGGPRVHVVAPVDRQALADVLAVLEARAC
jgi:transposase-like protein